SSTLRTPPPGAVKSWTQWASHGNVGPAAPHPNCRRRRDCLRGVLRAPLRAGVRPAQPLAAAPRRRRRRCAPGDLLAGLAPGRAVRRVAVAADGLVGPDRSVACPGPFAAAEGRRPPARNERPGAGERPRPCPGTR